MILPREFYLPFIERKQIAKDTYSFFFRTEEIDFEFLPGQYNRITLPLESIERKEVSQFFTIASSPLEKKHIIVTTKMGRSDFKKLLFNLRPGEQVKFFGPTGGFYLRDEELFEHVFIAGGIGITPFYSMIKYIVEKKLQIPVTLFVSFTLPEEMIYYDELLSIAKTNKHITVIYTITNGEQSKEKWDGEKGRISEELIKRYIKDISKPTYYIVGSPAMVINTEELLEQMGIASQKIKIEQFTGY